VDFHTLRQTNPYYTNMSDADIQANLDKIGALR
jgi:hypothetical protein